MTVNSIKSIEPVNRTMDLGVVYPNSQPLSHLKCCFFFFCIPVVLTLRRVSYELYLEQRALKPADLSKQGKNATQLEAKIERKIPCWQKQNVVFFHLIRFFLLSFFFSPLSTACLWHIWFLFLFSPPSFIFHIHFFFISLTFFEFPPLIY